MQPFFVHNFGGDFLVEVFLLSFISLARHAAQKLKPGTSSSHSNFRRAFGAANTETRRKTRAAGKTEEPPGAGAQ